jgi:hypothetical protein
MLVAEDDSILTVLLIASVNANELLAPLTGKAVVVVLVIPPVALWFVKYDGLGVVRVLSANGETSVGSERRMTPISAQVVR